MRKVTSIDSHRARHGAQSVSGTSPVSGVEILLFQQGQTFRSIAILPETGNLSLQYDALSRGKGETAGKAVHFTKATFNAAVHFGSRAFRI